MATDATMSDKRKAVAKGDTAMQKLQLELAEKLMEAFDAVVAGRSKYYNAHPDRIPASTSVPGLISSYANKNMVISGGISLIPGPWGMAAAIPEVALIVRNQLMMIYDIGMAHDKGQVLNRELLAGVFLSAMGTGAGGLLVMHGGKVFVRRVALRVFQRIIAFLAGKVTQQMLKSMVSKWLPVVGAAAMAAWSSYTTRQIGKKAVEILEKPIEVSAEEIADEGAVGLPAADGAASVTEQSAVTDPAGYAVVKIQALINLMKVDRKITPEEREYVEALIENSDIADDMRIDLANLIDTDTKPPVDFAIFAHDPDEAAGMMFDLVALARRDAEVHLAEKIYIKQAAKLMGLSEVDVIEALTAPMATA